MAKATSGYKRHSSDVVTTLATDKKMVTNGTTKYMNGNDSHLQNFENQINLTNGNRHYTSQRNWVYF